MIDRSDNYIKLKNYTRNTMVKKLTLNFLTVVKALATRRITIKCDQIPYQFHNIPWKKILNWIRTEASILRKPDRPWGWPTHLQIEPTNICNLRCSLCPVTEGMNRSRGHMDFYLFQKLIDEIGDYVFLIMFWDWGEPFVNSGIYEMISCAKQKGIKTVSSTNGHLFSHIENTDKLIRSGLDTLIVAMDGVTQETYEQYRQGGRIEAVLEGIRTIVARKRVLRSPTPFVNLRFLVMKHNEHEIPQLRELAKSLGVNALTFKTLNICANDTYGDKRTDMLNRGSKFLPDNHRYRRFTYARNGQSLIRHRTNPCKNLWNACTIHWDGIVCPCTYDYDERYALGDLKINSFKDIWFGAPYQRMRQQFRMNDERLYFCRECSYAYKGGSCIDETIADAFFHNSKNNE